MHRRRTLVSARLWRLLARARDLAALALIAEHALSSLSAWLTLAAILAILGAGLWARATALMATAATTHAKAVATENRLNALVTEVGSLSAGQTSEPVVSGTVVYTADANVSSNVSQTSDVYSGPTGSVSTGGPNAGSGVAAHTHGFGHTHSHGHDHSYGHVHDVS